MVDHDTPVREVRVAAEIAGVRTVSPMSVFRKVEANRREQGQRTVMLPVSGFEIDEVLQALAAVRSGDRLATERALGRLGTWDPVRVLAVLGTAAERYVKYLGDLRHLDLDVDAEGSAALIGRLVAALPPTNRISDDAMFDALVVCISPLHPNVQQRVNADIAGAIIGELHLLAALCTIAAEVPAGRIPNVAAMLHGILAPF